ncbi:OmpA family protein [Candidatus Marinimicrobia bacterium]|jgi:chemotaxis protein MotB|nr:OmpA family protein [Candidatus Neomarinimicrobiota bacterium]MDA9656721.1 OmpA family protein [Candidatus Neomarinimicrobiota bacterium]
MSYQKKAISIDERQAKSTAWALTFADVVTLLLTFFVLLLVMLNDAEKSINVIIDKLLDQTYEEMIKDLKSDEIMVERETKGIKITLRGNLFKSASSEIDMKYFPIIDKMGNILNRSDLINIQNKDEYNSLLDIINKRGLELNVEVRCEGHTDDAKLPRGSVYPSNWELSAARSLNLVKIMNKNALMPEKYFSAMGYGEFRPIVDIQPQLNFKEKQDARAANRRVEIYLDAFITQKYIKKNS